MRFVGLPLAALLCAVASTGCSHDIASPSLALSSVGPDLVCNAASVSQPDGITSVALAGTDFTPMPSRTLADPRRLLLPRVTLGPVAALPGGALPDAPIDITDDPADPAASRVHWTSEAAMSFDVAPGDGLATGVFDVTVTNPDGHHAAKLDQVLAIVPPPLVSMVVPPAVCDAESDQPVVVKGASFLVHDGATPSVTITAPSGTRTYASTVQDADCAPIPGSFTEANVRLCTALTFEIPEGDLAVTANTMVDLVVTNPAPADCASSAGIRITLDVPPRVDTVAPAAVCQGGAQLTIDGANFLPGAKVTMQCPSATLTASRVTVRPDGQQITATFGPGAPAEKCDVIVTNTDTCDDRPLPHKQIDVQTGPIAFFVDPAVAFNGINTRITIFATTVTPPLPAAAVSITANGVTTQLAFTTVPGFPNRVQAIVPEGQAPGTYDVTLEDGLHCPTTLPAAFTVTNTTTVTLKSVTAPFGDTASDTAVTIRRDTAAPAPNNHPLVATPRVFLNPHNAAATDVAVPLESVAFLDADRITGIVPAGTPVHLYDVVVVNPDGTVGLLDSGFDEKPTAPPEIDAAVPASIIDATTQKVQLAGKNFAAGDTIALACVNANGAAEAAPGVVAAAPACTTASCTQDLTIDGSGLTVGSVCIVRLTNADGTFADFSAIGVTNSSLNLNAPHVGPKLVVGRRALVAATGNATAANRFVYAIGGDDGTPAGALASVEFAPVDVFGTIGAFAIQPSALRAKRTLAGAVAIGRYLYIAGGNDGTGAARTAERALILSPRETPEVVDVDLQLRSAGLDPGEYHYRVSAMFAAADTDNPGGESLASDEFTIRVPSIQTHKVALTLIWRAPVDALGAAIPNVVGYRIYRTAKDGAPGSEVLIATTPTAGLTFVDDGTATPGTAVPLPLGTTGAWAALPDLATAREGVALAAARDPSDPSVAYVYALLGRSAPATANASYEFLPVSIAANGRQTAAAAWTAGTATSGQGRWQLGAWTVDATVSSVYTPPASEIFLGGGITAAGAGATRVEAGLVSAGGQLASIDDTPRDMATAQAGYGVCAANGQLFSFGGLNASPSGGAQSASLSSPAPALAPGAWNNEGLALTHGRYLMGSAVQSAFIFLLGGQTDEPSAASRSTELVIW